MSKPRVELMLEKVHFVDLVNKRIPDFTVDPNRVHLVRHNKTPASGEPPQPAYRYIIGLRGKGVSTAGEDFVHEHHLDAAKDRLHDRVRNYFSGHGNSLFAMLTDYRRVAELLIQADKPDTDKNLNKPVFTKREEKQIDKLIERLKGDHIGSKLVVIRGSFDTKQEFIEALNNALAHPHITEIPHLTSPLGLHEALIVGGNALTHAGKALRPLARNVPGGENITGGLVRAGRWLESNGIGLAPPVVSTQARAEKQLPR